MFRIGAAALFIFGSTSIVAAESFMLKVGRSPGSQFPESSAQPVVSMWNAIVDEVRYTGVNCTLDFSVASNRVIQVPDSIDRSRFECALQPKRR